MSSNTAHTQNDNHTDHLTHRLSTETKASTKTTEFFAYAAAVVARGLAKSGSREHHNAG